MLTLAHRRKISAALKGRPCTRRLRRGGRPRKWDAAEEQRLAALYDRGGTMAEVARREGRSLTLVEKACAAYSRRVVERRYA